MNLEGVESNINSTDGAFDGYNLFGLGQQNRIDPTVKFRSLMVTNMEGEVVNEAKFATFPQDAWVVHCAKFINSTTLIFRTEDGAVLWNIYDKTTTHLGFQGHHEYEYNPINNTFFTFREYTVEIDKVKYRLDKIEEYNRKGQIIWSLDTRSFISHTQWCPYRDMAKENADVTHSNSIFFDPEEDVLYVNIRNVNTFYKIDHKTGQVLWGLGEYGNFTLFDRYGNPQKNLFYHAHAVEKVNDDTFILFDNDFHNQTNVNNKRSRLLEITINETIMTANES